MASAIAIVSIVSSAIVAVAVTILSARLTRAQQLVQASVTRLDELRGVIDSAALQLRDALYDANGVWSLLDQDDSTNPPPAPVFAEFEKHLNEMDDSKTRIEVRLGRSSDLARRYESSREPLWALWEHFGGVIHHERDFDAGASERLLRQAAQQKDLFLDEASELLGTGVTLAATSTVKKKVSGD
jgi:hypothetical protein